MEKWNYTLHLGKNLHEAIDSGDIKATAKCLIACYRELLNKLSDEDKEWFEFDINEAIERISVFIDCIDRVGIEYEDQDECDAYLEDFYDIRDDLRAWISI